MKKNTNSKKRLNLGAYFAIAFLIFFLFVSFASAADIQYDSEINASICINESKAIMQEMQDLEFNVKRINDSLKNALDFFDSQKILKEKKKPYDFSLAMKYCNEIKTIKEEAIIALDEFSALKDFYNASINEKMNASSIDKKIAEINQEIENERYENVKPLVDQTYSDIINLKASYSALGVIYDNTTRNIKKFITDNWKVLLIILIILVILFIIYRTRISKWIISRKIEKLEIRKKNLKDLIREVQRGYFQDNTISEGEYSIKIKKFAELIRDIDRQTPLLQEELAKLRGKEWKFQKLKK